MAANVDYYEQVLLTEDAMIDKIGISDAADMLDRRIGTLRSWERKGRLPTHLMPQRDDRGWRYWTREQVEAIRQWMVDERMWPGQSLPNYKPSPEAMQRHLNGLRMRRVPISEPSLDSAEPSE